MLCWAGAPGGWLGGRSWAEAGSPLSIRGTQPGRLRVVPVPDRDRAKASTAALCISPRLFQPLVAPVLLKLCESQTLVSCSCSEGEQHGPQVSAPRSSPATCWPLVVLTRWEELHIKRSFKTELVSYSA